MSDYLRSNVALMFPLIKLAKKLKDKFLEANPSKEEEQFPLIKLAKKLKENRCPVFQDKYTGFH